MESIKVAAIDNPSPLFLDHIIPLSDLLNADLILRDIQNERLAKKYYPHVNIVPIISLEQSKEEISKNYDLFIHPNTWDKKLIETFFENPRLRSLYIPHGNSDKYPEKPWMIRPGNQDIVLIYGRHMIDYLKEKKAYDQIEHPILMGNLRYRYYQKYKTWFDNIVQKSVLNHLDREIKTLLYAPTFTEISSFFHITLDFIQTLAKKFNIIIKFHPNLADKNPELIYPFIGKVERLERVVPLVEFPPVYPVLEISDAYLGDFSSVGYDFLTYNRPMFFIFDPKVKNQRLTRLHSCGTCLDPKNPDRAVRQIWERIENDPFKEVRKKMYRYTFAQIEDEELKKQILSNVFANRGKNKHDTELV